MRSRSAYGAPTVGVSTDFGHRGNATMVNVGIIGLGFMGKRHFECYQANRKSRVVAIADVDPKKRAGDWSAIGGNIGALTATVQDLSGITTYDRADDLIADPNVHLVDICLPTSQHARYTLAALKAGKHVMCEKPMALNSAQCAEVVAAARRAPGRIMFGHCIRFWPEYVVAKTLLDSGRYGAVRSATFRRLSATPTWSWQNWLMDVKQSGGAAIDLHVHDTDYILWLFGKPQKVTSVGARLVTGGVDHIVTQYHYRQRNLQVTAEGGWMFPSAYPFEMAFTIVCEKGTLDYRSSSGKSLQVFLPDGRIVTPQVPAGDGYSRELDYFLACLDRRRPVETVTPASSALSVRVVEREIESVKTRTAVRVS
jgi:predicted dehydrogenase